MTMKSIKEPAKDFIEIMIIEIWDSLNLFGKIFLFPVWLLGVLFVAVLALPVILLLCLGLKE